jgi:hypothetical protein
VREGYDTPLWTQIRGDEMLNERLAMATRARSVNIGFEVHAAPPDNSPENGAR